jgi:ribosomal protein S18 acetylase RimI-like enzyme
MVTVTEAVPADARALARVHVDGWRTTYRGIVPDSVLSQLAYEERERMWQGILDAAEGQAFVYVAVDGSGQIVGFASGGPERSGDPDYKGELYSIYIADAYHRKGVGRLLAQAVAERLARAGLHAMLVWVLANNPARHFYEALGGLQARRQQITIAGVTLDDIGYGWTDTGILASRER